VIEAADKPAASRLAALHAAAFERPWSAEEIEKLFDNQALFALVCRAPEPVGFILAWAAAGEAEVLTLAVAPEARRQGRGGALVVAACAAAVVRGAGAIYLEVAEDNFAAHALYAKLGFTEAGRRAGYYGDGASAVVMRRTLPM